MIFEDDQMIWNKTVRKGMRAMAVLLCALMIFGLGGCGGGAGQGGDTDPEPIDGGTTNKTDANAPKHIESKDITNLDASFYLNTRWSGDQDGRFRFVISGPDGSLTAREETRGVSVPADKELLDELQAVIDRYDLAKQNGVYEVTAGLPPEYQEGWLTADYASGEKLTFTTNNDPYAMWAEDFYDVLSSRFLANGVDALEPDTEDSLIERLEIGRAHV